MNFTKNTSLLEIKRALSPKDFAQFLRSQGKIFYWDAARFFVVTDIELAKVVTKDPAFSADRSSFFISRMPNIDLRLIMDFLSLVQKMMVMSDGASHEQRRKAASLGIDGDLLDYFRPLIEKSVGRMINEAATKGSFDFATDIAEPLPSTVLADLFKIDQADRADFYRRSLAMTRFFGGASEYNNAEGSVVNQAATEIREYFRALLEKRRQNPQMDFFTVLLKSQEKFGLTDDEIIAQAVMMLVAGQVTTTDQLNNNMFTMLETGSADALRANPSLLGTALEEFNRLDPGVTFLFRTVKAPITLGGIELKPEDVVFVSNHGVNRDPEAFPEPDSCQLDRAKNPHFAYGHGPHFCLGARLARIQMQACFSALLQRFPGLKLDPSKPAERNHYALSFSGFSKLPLVTQ